MRGLLARAAWRLAVFALLGARLPVAWAQDVDAEGSAAASPAGGASNSEQGEGAPEQGEREGADGQGVASSPGAAVNPGVQAVSAQEAGVQVVPWANAVDVAIPAFMLQTQQRRLGDDRPPPSPEQVAALREMEAEVERFAAAAEGYHETVTSLLRREYTRKRRARDIWYGRQIDAEETILNEARERAIRLFERFIRRYPDDPRYTPDAMFRLGELYFERSAMLFQKAYEQARETGETPPDTPDYGPTVELYRRLAARFPDYRRIDGVYYLIGYTLNEMGEPEQALQAWLALVCANQHPYDPNAPEVPPEPQPSPEEQRAAEHPALTMDEEPPVAAAPEPFVDPYVACEPVRQEARFVSETWFRIGEYHFDDYSDPRKALRLAIAAYQRITENPEDKNYNLALYKLAWTYYRASMYPEAVKHFSMLVDWSDEQERKTGERGSELRPEAIQYLGITFAYDDWDENQIPDEDEGGPRPIQRVQDPALLPQDRPWTPEVYFHLGQVLFDEAKFDDAIEVWELALRRWPMHAKAPEIAEMIAQAHQEKKDREAAMAAWARLGEFGPGTDWFEANKDHPLEQRRAEELAERALYGSAIQLHEEAQGLRLRAVQEQDVSLLEEAIERYGQAADAYNKYLEAHPNSPNAYELRFNLADALFWSERYEEAARHYALVRDSNLDDRYQAEAARMVVESLNRLVEKAVERGELQIREEAPQPEGQPPKVRPLPVPELLQRLARAREIYLARIPEERDPERYRAAFDYNNAMLLYSYGYWDLARQRLERIFRERCKGPYANEKGKIAWSSLNDMAVALQDDAYIEQLARQISQMQCTFAPEGEAPSDIDCSKPENRNEPMCMASVQLTNIRFRKALKRFEQAQQAEGRERTRLFEEAAGMLLGAVEEEPNHPEAPLALEMAARALIETQRFESAARIYERIIEEVGPRRSDDPEEQAAWDDIVATAYFQLAYNAARFFDFETAVRNYRVLVDSPRFARSQSQLVRERRQDAIVNLGVLMAGLQRYREATRYYQEAVDMVRDPVVRRDARFQLAEIALKQRNYGRAVKLYREFIRTFSGDRDAGELVVRAYWRLAEIKKATRARGYEDALRDVVSAFERSGQQPGSLAAEFAAHAAFILANTSRDLQSFERWSLDVGRPRTIQEYVAILGRKLKEGLQRASALVQSFRGIPRFRRPHWTIAAYDRQGRVVELFVRKLLDIEFVLPRDLARQYRSAPPDVREDLRLQVEDAVKGRLDQEARPLECWAIELYAIAVRAGANAALQNEMVLHALDRLQAYGEERIAECIEERRKKDPTLAPYRPGEFRRALSGRILPPPEGMAPPPLVQGAQ